MSESVTPGARFQAFVELIARLRAPGGCPWDREQTHESLKPMTIEEAYEVVEAIDQGPEELSAELGDLLLQVVFHAQMASEAGSFTISDVIDHVAAKMVRRHPHVFGDVRAHTPGEVLRNWEAIKQAEAEAKRARPENGSMLDSVSRALPATMEAFQIATKVSRVGFDWPGPAEVLEKLDEEVAELKREAVRDPADHRALQDEVGDLFFVAVNVARLLGVDPESALKAASRKFRRRFAHVETRLREEGRRPAEAGLDRLQALWDEAKAREKDPAV